MLVTWSIPYSLGDAYVIMLYKWILPRAPRSTLGNGSQSILISDCLLFSSPMATLH